MPISFAPDHPAHGAIGIFDSGIGGLTILRAVREALPHEDLIYVADTAHLPYGAKSAEIVRARAITITGFLVERGAKAIVVACNTATAAAIDLLRDRFDLPFIGVEPAVKPAVAATRSRVIGVLATPATLDSARFHALLSRHAGEVRVQMAPCAGLAEQIERGDLDGGQTEVLLRGFVEPLLTKGADTIVLGCTHYPLVAHIIQRIAGPGVSVIENGTAVARELARQLLVRQWQKATGAGGTMFWASGPIALAEQLLGRHWARGVRVSALPEPAGVSETSV
jgi:glutamate racemase